MCTSVVCLRQSDVKALIAYRSIGHMGMVLAGILTCTEFGVKGAVVVVVAHGLTSPAMLRFARIIYDVTFSRRLAICKGILSVLPAACISFFLLRASNIAAPPLINLVGEIWLIISVVSFSRVCCFLVAFMCLFVGAYTLYLYTSLSHGRVSRFSNPSHMLRSCNHLIIYIQLWPLLVFIFNLRVLL